MIDPARALSVCHPIATIFITLLLASPALPPSPSSLSSAFSASSSSSPCCAFWCSVAKPIANSFTEILGFFISIFVAVVGFCGCSSCSLQQRLNSKKNLVAL
jgi:hypothetical protein